MANTPGGGASEAEGALALRDAINTKRKSILSNLVAGGGDGQLFLTEAITALSDQQPANTLLKCTSESQASDSKLVQSGIDEAIGKTKEFNKTLSAKIHPGVTTTQGLGKELMDLLTLAPRAVGEGMQEDSAMNDWVCTGLKAMGDKAANDRQIDQLTVWGTMLAGAAVTASGVGAAPGSAMMYSALLGAVAINASTAAYDWHKSSEAKELSDLYRTAGIAQGMNASLMNLSADQFREYRQARASAMINAGLSVAEVSGIVFQGLKNGNTLNKITEDLEHPSSSSVIADTEKTRNTAVKQSEFLPDHVASVTLTPEQAETRAKFLAIFDEEISNDLAKLSPKKREKAMQIFKQMAYDDDKAGAIGGVYSPSQKSVAVSKVYENQTVALNTIRHEFRHVLQDMLSEDRSTLSKLIDPRSLHFTHERDAYKAEHAFTAKVIDQLGKEKVIDLAFAEANFPEADRAVLKYMMDSVSIVKGKVSVKISPELVEMLKTDEDLQAKFFDLVTKTQTDPQFRIITQFADTPGKSSSEFSESISTRRPIYLRSPSNMSSKLWSTVP